jgi:hypothetical protein
VCALPIERRRSTLRLRSRSLVHVFAYHADFRASDARQDRLSAHAPFRKASPARRARTASVMRARELSGMASSISTRSPARNASSEMSMNDTFFPSSSALERAWLRAKTFPAPGTPLGGQEAPRPSCDASVRDGRSPSERKLGAGERFRREGISAQRKGGRFGDGTEEVTGALSEVHRHLGPGLMESAYEACLCADLGARSRVCLANMAYDGSSPTTPNPSVLPSFLCHSNEVSRCASHIARRAAPCGKLCATHVAEHRDPKIKIPSGLP